MAKTISIIGAGSNILIRDNGYRGLIIKLGKSFNEIYVNENEIISGAGILDVNLAKSTISLPGADFNTKLK